MDKSVTDRRARHRYSRLLSGNRCRAFIVVQIIGLFLAFACQGSIAAGDVQVSSDVQALSHLQVVADDQISAPRLSLNDRVHYLEDIQGDLDLADVKTVKATWQPNSDAVFNRGFSDSVWWLKLHLDHPGLQGSERLLEIAHPILDRVDVYLVQNEKLLRSYQTGDSRPFHDRPLISRFFVFPVQLPPQDSLTVYIRIQTSSSLQVPLTLWEKDAFFQHEANNNFLQGLYFGGTFTLVIYNLLIFFSLRDRTYLYYVGFVASAPLYFLALNGLGFRFLWPENTNWNTLTVPVFLSFLVIFGALFTRRFLELKRFSKAMDRIILGFALIGGAALLGSFSLPYRIITPLLAIVVIFACLADMMAGVYAWRRQVASARFYVFAWTVFLLGSVIFAFSKLNILPSNIFTDNVVQVGSILEAVLLSFALADRINFERRLRFKAQEESLLAQMRANETLELRVAERTHELAELNLKLEELSYTDQLTQLYNRRFLDETTAKEWHRCMRKKADFAVLLLDIDHFKQVNDQYGHNTGDQCLQQVAFHLRDQLRWSTDIVARYGGEEFCIVLPETGCEAAMQVAQRIVAAFNKAPLHTDEGDIRVTVSIGVSCAKPQQDLLTRTLFTEADAALYAAKSAGRNRAVLFSAISATQCH